MGKTEGVCVCVCRGKLCSGTDLELKRVDGIMCRCLPRTVMPCHLPLCHFFISSSSASPSRLRNRAGNPNVIIKT